MGIFGEARQDVGNLRIAMPDEAISAGRIVFKWHEKSIRKFTKAFVPEGYCAVFVNQGQVIGLVVENQCNYFAPLSFPQRIQAGMRVSQRGRSSVRYEVGLFAENEILAAAAGHFVHVYVDRASRRPVELPTLLANALQDLMPTT